MSFNRLFYLTAIALATVVSSFQPGLFAQSIAVARAQPEGSTVTVRGIVTNGAELGKIRYLQDGSAGIAAFPGTGSVSGFDGVVFPGDSIEVTGTLVSYHDLLEITPITAFNILSTGNPLPAPKSISIAQISEELESQLVEFECITFGNPGGVFSNGGAYDFADADGQTADVYFRSGHPMLGSAIPSEPVRLRAILSEFDDFQLLPRTAADFGQNDCFFFTQKLEQSAIGTTGFWVSWKTNVTSDCILRIDTTPNIQIQFQVAGTTTDHSYQFTDLLPGTVYWVQIEAQHNGEIIFSEPVPFATQSLSSGQVEVFFNHGMDPDFANGNTANGETFEAVLSETIARIDAAQKTLDVAMYNNSRNDITNALKAAQARGVRVRYVAALDASNVALDPAPTFPVLYGNSSAIMHNKFMIIDADITDKAWVMGGSMNWTNQNMATDFNNTLFIQDQSLARAYRIEFEEMWGSAGTQPDPINSRFGAAKRNNTPHRFIIGGHPVESYFSPSDQTTSRIETVLRSAQSEALFAAFSFTKNELGYALVDLHNASVPLRGIMENISDLGAEYDFLLANGVDVRHHYLSGEFHHKYGVVDAYDGNSDPTVVTGSHNWSVAAETVNDENTLILHNPVLATLYKAEFEKRWREFPVGTQMLPNQTINVFPNPASGYLELSGVPEEAGVFWIKNALGQTISSIQRVPGVQPVLQIEALHPGQYFVTFVSAHVVASIPFQKI